MVTIIIGTQERFIILDGRIEVVLQSICDARPVGKRRVEHVEAGQVFIIEPMVCHEFILYSVWLNFYQDK